jgi:hypothetical protein
VSDPSTLFIFFTLETIGMRGGGSRTEGGKAAERLFIVYFKALGTFMKRLSMFKKLLVSMEANLIIVCGKCGMKKLIT